MTEIFWLEQPFQNLGICKRPKGKNDLIEEIQFLESLHLEVLVSCLTETEIFELGLENEKNFCYANQIEFINFPIDDRNIPESLYSYKKLLLNLKENYLANKKILIHCRAGIGRSALTLAGLLIILGENKNIVFEKISESRKINVPDTNEQIDYILNNSDYFLE